MACHCCVMAAFSVRGLAGWFCKAQPFRAVERAGSTWLWRCIMSAPTPNSEGRGSVYSPCGSANRTELCADVAGDTDGREQANDNMVTLVT